MRWSLVLCGSILLYQVIAAGSEHNASEFALRELLVQFSIATTGSQIKEIEDAFALKRIGSLPFKNAWHYSIPEDVRILEVVSALRQLPEVKLAEPNYLRRALATPIDHHYSNQWYLTENGQDVPGTVLPGSVNDIDWQFAMGIYTGTHDTIVAVLDSGVSIDHPDLILAYLFNEGDPVDGIDNDGNGYIDDYFGWDFYDDDSLPLDENGHGTLVAGVIAATQNQEGIAGVAPHARIIGARLANDFGRFRPGFIQVAHFLLATEYAAERGARIINASFGGGSYSDFEYLQIESLRSRGILVIAAAGNGGLDGQGDNNDVFPFYPASYDLDNIISVAATDRNGELTLFSNYGPISVDVAAPGHQIFGPDISRSTVYIETFSSALEGWLQGHRPDSQSEIDWTIYTDTFGNNWATDSEFSNYQPATNSYIQSPFISLPFQGPQLEFSSSYDLALFDWLWIEVSTDGFDWTPVDLLFGTCDYCTTIIDLSFLESQTVKIQFRLETDSFFESVGVYIDELQITELDIFNYDGSQYRYDSGTSFAAPIVAGVAALIWSQKPDLPYYLIPLILELFPNEKPELAGKVRSSGVVSAFNALFVLLEDTDEDDIDNGDEWSIGTDPFNPDSDNDGFTDFEEFNAGTDPLTATLPRVLDVNLDGAISTLEDGLVILRFMFGFRGSQLIDGVDLSSGFRLDAQEIEAHMSLNQDLFDIDQNNQVNALTDGILILRYLFGFSGEALVESAVDTSACQTCNSSQVADRVSALTNLLTVM